jgi:hypothetical protein
VQDDYADSETEDDEQGDSFLGGAAHQRTAPGNEGESGEQVGKVGIARRPWVVVEREW